MKTASRCVMLMGCVVALATGLAQAGEAVAPLGKTLAGWKFKRNPEKSQWAIGIAKVDADNPRSLSADPLGEAAPELVNVGGHGVDIYTEQTFGDCTVEVEVLVPKGSNSGVYLCAEYEVQVLDSHGKEKVGPGDMGGIYHTAAPSVNAARPAGEWQQYVIVFRAARFEADKKTENARFIKVTLNGQTIHENVEVKGSTGGGLTGRDVPVGPLMFQGDHGSVAYRNIKITPAK